MGHHVGEPPTTGTTGPSSATASDVFVATFGVYDEGRGVRSLYLHPTAAVRLGAALLPLCLLGGPVFLLGADVAQRWALGGAALQPGVMMSLVGGPFFLFLLVRQRSRLLAW